MNGVRVHWIGVDLPQSNFSSKEIFFLEQGYRLSTLGEEKCAAPFESFFVFLLMPLYALYLKIKAPFSYVVFSISPHHLMAILYGVLLSCLYVPLLL